MTHEKIQAPPLGSQGDPVCPVVLGPSGYCTLSLRWTKATLIYRRTGNLRAVQLLLGHAKVESTVR